MRLLILRCRYAAALIMPRTLRRLRHAYYLRVSRRAARALAMFCYATIYGYGGVPDTQRAMLSIRERCSR